MTYYTRVPGFSDIGRTRFSITFALYVNKIFISRVCKCVTRNVFSMCRKKNIHQYVKPCLSKNPRYTFFTIKSSLTLAYKSQMFFFVCLQSILFWVSHDLFSTLVRQAKSITFYDVVHRDIEALDDNVQGSPHLQ
jgi:hypothetical protein